MARSDLLDEALLLMESQTTGMSFLDRQVFELLRSNLVSFTGWYNMSDVGEIVLLMASVLGPMLKAAATLMDGWMADNLSMVTGKPFRPVGTRNTDLGRRVDQSNTLRRAADTYRYQQSMVDAAFQKAANDAEAMPEIQTPIEAAIQRAFAVTNMDFAVTRRNQAQKTLQSAGDKIIGYRRVIHPELDKEGVCGLCVAASTRLYHVSELMPLHDGCQCTPLPVTKSHDPGGLINDQDIGRIYAEAGGTSRAALQATKFRIDQHGELGPILTPVDQPIRTAAQAKRDEKNAPAKTPQEKHRTLSRLHDRLEGSLQKFEQNTDWVKTPEDQNRWESTLHQMEQRIAQLEHDLAA